MHLKYLKTFLVLNEKKNFTKAAEALGCAQSGVTTHIKLLENELGVRLFERIGKSVTLTGEGDRLLPFARRILSLSSEIESLYKGAGRLTIGVTESAAGYLIEDILKEFSALYPNTEIFLKIPDYSRCIQMLCDGEIDAAIVLDTPIQNKSIQVLQKRKEQIILTASTTHALSGKHTITDEDFETYGILLPSPNCPYRRLFEEKLLSRGIRVKTALETDSVSVIKAISLCGTGLGLLPEFAVKKELIYHMLEKLNYKMDYPIYTQLLIHRDKWLSPDLKRFTEIAGRHLT